MLPVHFTDLSGRSFSTDLPADAKVQDALQFLATSLGLGTHQIWILNLDPDSHIPFHPPSALIFSCPSSPNFHFQVLFRGPAPAASIPRDLASVMDQSNSQSYLHAQYRQMLQSAPPDLARLIEELLPICGDRAKCEEALLMAHGDANRAANILLGRSADRSFAAPSDFDRRFTFARAEPTSLMDNPWRSPQAAPDAGRRALERQALNPAQEAGIWRFGFGHGLNPGRAGRVSLTGNRQLRPLLVEAVAAAAAEAATAAATGENRRNVAIDLESMLRLRGVIRPQGIAPALPQREQRREGAGSEEGLESADLEGDLT
jgi:hypothetical protein